MPLEFSAAVWGQGHGLCLQEQCWVMPCWDSLAVGLAGSCSPAAVLSMDVGVPPLSQPGLWGCCPGMC